MRAHLLLSATTVLCMLATSPGHAQQYVSNGIIQSYNGTVPDVQAVLPEAAAGQRKNSRSEQDLKAAVSAFNNNFGS